MKQALAMVAVAMLIAGCGNVGKCDHLKEGTFARNKITNEIVFLLRDFGLAGQFAVRHQDGRVSEPYCVELAQTTQERF